MWAPTKRHDEHVKGQCARSVACLLECAKIAVGGGGLESVSTGLTSMISLAGTCQKKLYVWRVGDAERPVDPYLDLGLVAIELDELQFEALSLSDPKFDLNGSANTSARSTVAIYGATRTSERRRGRACLVSGTLPCEFGGAEPPLQNFLLWAFAASRPRIEPLFKSK